VGFHHQRNGIANCGGHAVRLKVVHGDPHRISATLAEHIYPHSSSSAVCRVRDRDNARHRGPGQCSEQLIVSVHRIFSLPSLPSIGPHLEEERVEPLPLPVVWGIVTIACIHHLVNGFLLGWWWGVGRSHHLPLLSSGCQVELSWIDHRGSGTLYSPGV
jgi:hypothetical protein